MVQMKHLLLAAALALAAAGTLAQAAESACEAKAMEKHLSGAARTSFITKCEKDAKVASAKEVCEAQATEKKLHGAARKSFTKKCVADAAK